MNNCPQPNVLFLVVDSLRYDALLGDWDTDTPNVDQLASDGVTFTNCFSQGISTSPAMTAMLTGTLPLDYSGHWLLQDDRPTFAEVFQKLGYETRAFHSNPYVSSRRNFDRGFDSFIEDTVAFEPDEGLEGASEKLLRLANRFSRLVSRTPYTPASPTNENTLSSIGESSSPWFHWTQYMDVHGPYLGGDDYRYRNKFSAEKLWLKAAVRNPEGVTKTEHKRLKEKYALEVEYLDEMIGDLLKTLESKGELDDTIVVVTSDHGDEFYEHGLYGHKNLPYDELTHVPLIMRFPDSMDTPPGATVDSLVRSIDILPTVLDSIGDPPEFQDRKFSSSESLLPLIRGDTRSKAPMVVTEKRVRGEDALRIGLRTNNWKYLYDGETNERVLYDLTSDPDESTNLIDQEPSVAAEFNEKLDARLRQIKNTSTNTGVPSVQTDSGVEERLKALGYRE